MPNGASEMVYANGQYGQTDLVEWTESQLKDSILGLKRYLAWLPIGDPFHMRRFDKTHFPVAELEQTETIPDCRPSPKFTLHRIVTHCLSIF
jgi:hypothetical protein